jgi:uncharacterized protein (DUF433 family)
MSSKVETTTLPSVSIEHIEITPGVCGGKPRIAGHRIKVQHIVIWHEQMKLTPAEILEQHPGLTLADVHAALAYYHDHKEQIDADLRADEEFVAEIKAKAPPSLLQQKLKERHAQDNSLPPG